MAEVRAYMENKASCGRILCQRTFERMLHIVRTMTSIGRNAFRIVIDRLSDGARPAALHK